MSVIEEPAVEEPVVREDEEPTADDRPGMHEHEGLPAAEPVPASPERSLTAYHVVAVLHGTIEKPVPQRAPAASPVDTALERLREETEPDLPFILGGYFTPEVFESSSGPAGAKRAALTAHPELAACVRSPGISLATWPARSYEFKKVGVEPQPDKWVI